MTICTQAKRPLFPLGKIVATPGALASLERSGDSAFGFFHRHACGDFGTVCQEDRRANEQAIRDGERVLSAYLTTRSEKFWIITEADRSVTTILLPDEY